MIFETDSKKRWTSAVIILISAFILAAVLVGSVVVGVINISKLPSISNLTINKGKYLTDALAELQRMKDQNSTTPDPSNTSSQGNVRHTHHINRSRYHGNISSLGISRSGFLRSAFVSTDDDDNIKDLKQHLHMLDMVFPDYFQLVPGKVGITENVNADVQQLFAHSSVLVAPSLSNLDATGNWRGLDFITLVNNDENRAELEALILATLQKYSLRAINIDIEDISAYDMTHYLDFLDELSDLLHKNNMNLIVDVPVNDDQVDYEEIGKVADYVVVMDYDEHYEESKPGPIASRDWFEDSITDITKRIPKDKIIGGVGQYAYDWNTDTHSKAQTLSFDDVIQLASDIGADVQTDNASVNSTFSYIDTNKQTHEVWLLDGISMWNEMKKLENLGVRGVSMWSMGMEDPSIWSFFRRRAVMTDPSILQKDDMLNPVQFDGEGEILKVQALPSSGKRVIMPGENGMIDYADYDTLPTGYLVQKFGKQSPTDIALTFDDGPDPINTPQILNILKANNVPATFFVIGDQALHYPKLVQQEAADGFMVGNHTFYHPDPTAISPERLRLELNATQRLLQSLTGRKTSLFRSPYNTYSYNDDKQELAALHTAESMGYVMVGADVDSEDYNKPGVNTIISTVEGELKESGSNIIVFHDGGGDRTQTIQALKELIPDLKSKGYHFVGVNDLIGVPKAALMSKLNFSEAFLVISDKVITWIVVYGWDFIAVLFYITTLISIFRILFMGIFVIRSSKQTLRYENAGECEFFVSVLIPAYNEETVIVKTLDAVLQSSYKNYEVILIDDGSTDKTVEIVQDYIVAHPSVRLLTKKNGGKYSALNLGLNQSNAEYIITIDADTSILPDTVQNLMNAFKDAKVDAVCGNVQVGNVKNLLTRFQALEYITTQNYDRRAFDSLNCIGVVPGATGAWRKSKLIEVGGYSNDTLTEDADLTLTMLEHGAKIVYMPSAKSITEAPQKVSALYKQRFRWTFGTMQCLWKHRKSFFKGTLGTVALPNIFIFQVLFPVLSPIGDIVFILSIFKGYVSAILAGYILFLLMDVVGSLIAFALDKSPIKFMWPVLIQRFFYRQFMYIITFRSLGAILKGRRHGWNKLKRTNSVVAPAAAASKRIMQNQ